MTTPPFRFGIQCSTPPDLTAGAWRDLARKVEDLGYHRLTVSDHLDDQLAPVAALMAAADATTTLRVGALVFCNDYRHPAVLAKEAATLDVLSEGRFELGLGAGWMVEDYARAGIPMDAPGVRIARLEEAIEVVTALFAGAPVHHEGEHYRIDGLVGSPRPLQSPIPLLVGGGGRKVLELAGRHAHIVGLNPKLTTGRIDASAGPDGTAEQTLRKIGWIRDAAGDRFDEIELHTRIHLAAVTDARDEMADALAAGFGLTPEEALASPHALCGTVDQIVDDLVERRDRFGIASIGLSLDALEAMAPVVARLAGT
ncbi:MAG: TIGR03621 family F420-dependent LLM class oxidoreductase [Actinobacteria bacterium]|nr:TIGR03621 family F420-dependent LLM class oxidoreductase [Actinomycetota bacterium]